jgi:hypothetical protein
MADIKTLTETLEESSYEKEATYLKHDGPEEVLTVKLLKEKIDELVVEINAIKASLE